MSKSQFKSQCKPGDLAIIIAGQNAGLIVHVKCRPSFVRMQNGRHLWKHPILKGELSATDNGNSWVVEGNLKSYNIHRETINYISHGVIADKYLQPLPGPEISDDEYSEIEITNQGKLLSDRLAEAFIGRGGMYGEGFTKKYFKYRGDSWKSR